MRRLNEAEWIIEPFYECETRGLSWVLTSGVDSARLLPEWCAASVMWDSADAGAMVATIECDYNLDLLEADRICLRVSHAESHRVTIRARADGARATIVEAAAGENHFSEFEGPIQGRRLQHLSIEISTIAGGDGKASLLWIIAVDSRARERYRRLRPTYDPAWPVLLKDEIPQNSNNAAESGGLHPRLGLFVPEGGAGTMRERTKNPAYRRVWQQIRRSAESCLESRPEEGILDHLPRTMHGSRYEHSLDRIPSPEQEISTKAMTACGLVGLVESNERFARVAARHLLAAAHCGHWDDSFMMTQPGGLWDHRAFTAMDFTEAFVRALDWAGSMLTPSGIDLAARTLSTKALPMIDYSLRRYAYMRENNQAIFFASSGVLAVSTLGRILDYGGDGLDWYLAALRESVESYILDDGGTYEGPVYHDSSCSRAIKAFEVAARYLDQPVRDLMPEALLRTQAHYRVVASTSVPGSCINTSDGGRFGWRPAGGAVPALARLTGDRDLRTLTAALCLPDGSGEVQGAVAVFCEGPQDLEQASPAEVQQVAPLFEVMPRTGMLCSSRPTDNGPVRIQFVGAKPNAGHGHEDKGSLVLEAYGEEMLVDRGTCFYGDARSALLKFGFRHNIVTPNGADGRPLHQLNPALSAFVPCGSGDETRLKARMDVSAAWPDALQSCVRALESDDPGRLTIRDTVHRHESGTLSVHFQSRFPWVQNGKGWTSSGTRARVTVQPLWKADDTESEEDLFDSTYQPVYRLSLFTGRGSAFDLETRLDLEPAT